MLRLVLRLVPVFVVLIVLSSLSVFAAIAIGQTLPLTEQVVYTASLPHQWMQVSVFDINRALPVNTRLPINRNTLDWTDDGSTLLVSGTRNERQRLYALDYSSRPHKRWLAQLGRNFNHYGQSFNLSPDSKRIVYILSDANAPQISIHDVETSERYLNMEQDDIAVDPGNITNRWIPGYVLWSPDERYGLINANYTDDTNPNNPVYKSRYDLIEAGTGETWQLQPDETISNIFWVGNTSQMVYVLQTFEGNLLSPPTFEHRIYDAATGEDRLLTDEPIAAPTFSPDNNRMVYIKGAYRANAYLNMLNAYQSSGGNVSYALSTIGIQWLYNADQFTDQKLYMLDLNTGEEQLLTDHTFDDFPQTQWLADGKRLLLTTYKEADPRTGIYDITSEVLDLETGEITPLTSPDGKVLTMFYGYHQYGSFFSSVAIAPFGARGAAPQIPEIYTTHVSNPNDIPEYYISLDQGRSFEKLAVNGTMEYSSMSPDGRYLIFNTVQYPQQQITLSSLFSPPTAATATPVYQTHLLDLASGELREALEPSSMAGVYPLSFGYGIWSADSKHILFQMGGTETISHVWENVDDPNSQPRKTGIPSYVFNISWRPVEQQ